MERKDFLKNGVWGFATVLTGIGFAGDNKNGNKVAGDDCDVSGGGGGGDFPTKAPA